MKIMTYKCFFVRILDSYVLLMLAFPDGVRSKAVSGKGGGGLESGYHEGDWDAVRHVRSPHL